MADGTSAQRVGRYEIVGHLATGGMAEVLLARLRGPHGFERPLVIKRMLPHLAADPLMVDMFLDEARIIANLRHPNLVHVHELGREGADLFMAMEFLEGESVAGVCRRLARLGTNLDFALAAHVVAEACAGLHAAHEATTPDGRPLEIVHRDVSPQNVFVEYSGAVHVIDFGIATNVDRVGRTEAGTVRGKFEYLAPEHIEGRTVDRRADVFALGVVLFELVTGRRLYKRDNHAATMMAILSEPVPDIASFRQDTPARLGAICSRALVKRREERYATVAEMRRDLLAFLRVHTDQDVPDVLGRLMREMFSDRVAEKSEMLRRVSEGARLDTVPVTEVDAFVELPTVCETAHVVDVVGAPEAPRGARRWLLPAGGLLAACAVAAGAVDAWRVAHGTPDAVAHLAPVTASLQASTEPSSAPEPALRPDGGEATTAAVATDLPADPPHDVKLRRTQAAPRARAASQAVRPPASAPHASATATHGPTLW
jgi:serine/threonine protein kinase